MADFGGGDLDAFRVEARAWIEANFPAELKGKPNPMMREEASEPSPAQAAWKKAMGEKGWGVPTWPAAYGGGGLSPAEGRVVQQELGRAGAYNPIGGMGVMMFGSNTAPRSRRRSTSRASSKARSGGVRAIPSPAPAPTWPPCRPAARTRAITS